MLESGLKIKDTNGLIGTVNADVFLQSLIDDITNRVVNQILTKSMLINNGLATEAGKYPLDAAFGKTLADKDTELASSIAQLNTKIKDGTVRFANNTDGWFVQLNKNSNNIIHFEVIKSTKKILVSLCIDGEWTGRTTLN